MRASKLFHAIVVVGASLTACGGDDDDVADAGRDASAAVDSAIDDAALADARDANDAIDSALAEDAALDDAGDDAFVAIL